MVKIKVLSSKSDPYEEQAFKNGKILKINKNAKKKKKGKRGKKKRFFIWIIDIK